MTDTLPNETVCPAMQASDYNTDIVVVGAGLVGMSAAIACSRLGLQVSLIDAGPAPSESLRAASDLSWDHRIYAISPGNAAWLQTLGIWQHMQQSRICPISAMQITGDIPAHGVELLAAANHIPALGFILENSELHKAMAACVHLAKIRSHFNTKLTALHVAHDVARLQLSNGSQIEAALVIAADGAQSATRQMLNIGVSSMTYPQEAVVANFHCSNDHQGIARQWFLGESILAMLPLPDQHYSMVWSTPLANSLLAMSTRDLADHVQQTCHHASMANRDADKLHHGRFSSTLNTVTSARKFKLMKQTADSMISPCVAIAGDAGHLVHPLAGQGANLGFRDVITLVECLKNRHPHQGLGDSRLLRQYERSRKTDMLAMRYLSHGLHGLFQHPAHGMRWIRNLGLNLVNHQPSIKRLLVQQAVR